ncbi:MAG TPA: hypothetical protein VJ761_22040, partial [Ktedonobacteraceae bacterium]|nr:hypothetical protein [Ktedonobacteraceae bacterium]
FALSNISAEFLYNPNNSGEFDYSQPKAFTQKFQVINFNPDPADQNCNPATGVDESTLPFTDVYPASSPGGPCKTVKAQNKNGTLQAGLGTLAAFQAGFTGSISVPNKGTLTLNITSDDGFIFSVGPHNGVQPTPGADNPMINAPPSSPIKGYKVIAANNQPSPPVAVSVVTTFPKAGTYPMELDYTECCAGDLTLFMTPPQTLWGVDSSDHITESLYNSVTQTYSAPDFWGRYIGDDPDTYPKDMDSNEPAIAHNHGFAILPIYFNYAPSKVKGYKTGQTYAMAAIEDALGRLKIGQGVVLFSDIEDSARPDAKFIEGWYDTFYSNFSFAYQNVTFTYTSGYYQPGYYGNGTVTSRFAIQYCLAVLANPQIGTNSFIWSSEPSGFNRRGEDNAPPYSPFMPFCTNQTSAWQFAIAPNRNSPNVDTDEALLDLTLWEP